jgi:outer membrane protein assembly factor BamB
MPAPAGYQGVPGYQGPPGYLPGGPAPGPGYQPQPFRPERGTSRRGLIVGLAAFAGVAAVGGTVAAVVSSEKGQITPPGPVVPAPSGLSLYHGEGAARGLEWKFAAGDRIQAGPGAGNGAVYFVTEGSTLYAIDIATRRKLWTQSADNVYAAPRLVGGLVLATTSAGHVLTFDAATGKPAWTLTSGISGSVYQQNLAVSGGTVIVPSLESPPAAYDARTGAPKNITYSVPDNYVPAITAAGGVVYAMVYGGTMYAFNAATGAKLWSSNLYSSGKVVTGLVADGGSLYLGTESDPGTLYAIDAASGNVKWKYQPGGIVFTAPVPANGMVYLKTATNGAVHALDGRTGKLAWKHAASVSGSGGLAVAGGRIYYSLSLAMQAVDAKTGAPLWKFDPGNYDAMSTTPAVTAGLVVIGSSDGTLYAIKQ